MTFSRWRRQAKTLSRGFADLQRRELGLHLQDPLPIPGPRAVHESSLERIIERIQSSIVDARGMRLKMLEQILSIALLEAYESREPAEKPYSSRPHHNGY
jgi:hypothetical protein